MHQKIPQHRALASHNQVKVANIPGKKLEHQGIKVQLIGSIELATERGHPHDFVSLGKPLYFDKGPGLSMLGGIHKPLPSNLLVVYSFKRNVRFLIVFCETPE